MKTQPKRQIEREASAFAKFLYAMPPGTLFSLWNIQGSMRFVVPGIPCEKAYEQPLQIASYWHWFRPVQDTPNVYQRTNYKRSALGRLEQRLLGERIARDLMERETRH